MKIIHLALIAWVFTMTVLLQQGCSSTGPDIKYAPPTTAITNEIQRATEVARIQQAFPQAVDASGHLDLAAVSNQLYNTPSRVEKYIIQAGQANSQIPNPYTEIIGAGLLIAGLVTQTIRHGRAQEIARKTAMLVHPDLATSITK